MGFVVSHRVHKAQLRGTEFEGAWARAEGITVEEWEETMGDKAIATLFYDRLVDWSLESEPDVKVPATRDAAKALPADLVKSLIAEWWAMATGVVRDRPFAKTAQEAMAELEPAAVNGTAETVGEPL